MTAQGLQRQLFGLIVIMGPFSVTLLNKPVLVLSLLTGIFLLILVLIQGKSVHLERLSLRVLCAYSLTFLVGFISLGMSVSQDFGILVSGETLGRLFTISVVLVTLLSGAHWLASADDKTLKKISSFWLIPGAVFLFFALYQLFCNLTGRPFFIETRDWMHGVPMALREVVPKRLTSIADEPSFYAPVLLEFMLLVFFLVKRFWLKWALLVLSGLVLLLTFSGGGYVNALFLGFIACCLLLWKKPRSPWLWGIIVFAVIALGIIFSVGQVLLEFAVNKFIHESSGGSSRGQFMADLLALQVNAGFWSLLLGHGLTSMSALADFGMMSDDVLFRISNNMFLDILWESGVLGLAAVLFLYLNLFFAAFKMQSALPGRLSLSLLLVCQSLITSLYRSEYISTHLIWMLLLILWSIRWEKLSLTSTRPKFGG